jgi:hypothetical protein
MDVIQRRLLNELNFSNKNTINFFNNTLDPIIALTLIAVLDISLLLLVGAWTAQKVFTMETSQK